MSWVEPAALWCCSFTIVQFKFFSVLCNRLLCTNETVEEFHRSSIQNHFIKENKAVLDILLVILLFSNIFSCI